MAVLNIMLAEDTPDDVLLLQHAFKQAGLAHRLEVVCDGMEAMEYLNGDKAYADREQYPFPDVLLLDLNMPRMNGLELLAAIRNDPRLKNIRVFVMTTSQEPTDRNATDRLGVSGYLIKPMSYRGGYNRVDSMEHFVQFHLRNILIGGGEISP